MNDRAGAYRPDIDGLRAVAVLSVLFGHAGFFVPGGYVGVDVFFVISGYLITGIILKEIEAGDFALSAFWERRIRRIMPALLVMTVVTLVAGWFLLIPGALVSMGRSVIALALLASNVHFWHDTGYFAPAAHETPLLHTWSLAVEEQFYLVVPLFMLLMLRLNGMRHVFAILTAGAAASFVLSAYQTGRHGTFYLMPTRAWELIVGALLSRWTQGPPASRDSKRWRTAAAFLGAALILVPCFLYSPATPFPGAAALPPTLGAALLIGAGHAGRAQKLPFVNAILASAPVVFVGQISYSLYLWHWPLLAFATAKSSVPLGLGTRGVIVVASLALGTLSWRYVERPFRNRQVLPRRASVLLFGLSGLLVLLGVGVVLVVGDGFESRLPERARLFARARKVEPRYIHEMDANDVPGRLLNLGDVAAAPGVLVWGDSKAMALLPAIEAIGGERGFGIRAATHSATAPLYGYAKSDAYGLLERNIAFSAAVLDYVKAAHIRAVVLACYWERAIYQSDPAFRPTLMRTIDLLHAAGAAVYFVEDIPNYTFDVSKELVDLSWRGRDPSVLAWSQSDNEARDAFYASFVPELARRGVTILDPVPILRARSGGGLVLPFDEEGSFYRDATHLSTYGSLAVKEMLVPVFSTSPESDTAR